MSWNDYITDLQSKGVQEAAIYGKNGTLFACSDGLKDVTADQIKVLCGPCGPMAERGPTVGKMKCHFLRDDREDDTNLCLQLKGNQDCGRQTVCVGQSNTALVIGVGPPNSSITDPVFKTTQHLKKSNF